MCSVRAVSGLHILSVSVDPHEMSWAKVTLSLAPLCKDMKSEDLLIPFLLMWIFMKKIFHESSYVPL